MKVLFITLDNLHALESVPDSCKGALTIKRAITPSILNDLNPNELKESTPCYREYKWVDTLVYKEIA